MTTTTTTILLLLRREKKTKFQRQHHLSRRLFSPVQRKRRAKRSRRRWQKRFVVVVSRRRRGLLLLLRAGKVEEIAARRRYRAFLFDFFPRQKKKTKKKRTRKGSTASCISLSILDLARAFLCACVSLTRCVPRGFWRERERCRNSLGFIILGCQCGALRELCINTFKLLQKPRERHTHTCARASTPSHHIKTTQRKWKSRKKVSFCSYSPSSSSCTPPRDKFPIANTPPRRSLGVPTPSRWSFCSRWRWRFTRRLANASARSGGLRRYERNEGTFPG